MARVQWDSSSGVYESGLDRGVLYPHEGAAVAWNGLTKVEERSTGQKLTPTYYEGRIYRIDADKVQLGARIGAYTYPSQLDDLVGNHRNSLGIMYGGQEDGGYFSFSYRTLVSGGYKLHVYFNQKATPVDVTRATTSSTPEALEFAWDTTGVPVWGLTRPTTYVVLDSRYVDPVIMNAAESHLYGSETSDPSIHSFAQFLRDVERSGEDFIIARSNEAEWTILGPDEKIEIENQEFKIEDIEHEYTSEGVYKLFEDEE